MSLQFAILEQERLERCTAFVSLVRNHLVRNSTKNPTVVSCDLQIIFDYRVFSRKLKFDFILIGILTKKNQGVFVQEIVIASL